MNKVRLMIIAMIFLSINIPAIPDKDFLANSWGDSLNDIKKKSGEEIIDYKNIALIEASVAFDKPVDIWYRFKESRLAGGTIEFRKYYDYGESLGYVEDFLQINKLLTSRYGTPYSYREIWKDDSLKNSYRALGIAVSNGDLRFRSEWRTQRSVIIHELKSVSMNEIKHLIDYIEINTYMKELKNQK